MQAARDSHLADKDADSFATIVCNTCISKCSFVVRKTTKDKKARQPERSGLERGKVRHKPLGLICFSCYRDEGLSCAAVGGPFALLFPVLVASCWMLAYIPVSTLDNKHLWV